MTELELLKAHGTTPERFDVASRAEDARSRHNFAPSIFPQRHTGPHMVGRSPSCGPACECAACGRPKSEHGRAHL